jgi:hypothetical protein
MSSTHGHEDTLSADRYERKLAWLAFAEAITKCTLLGLGVGLTLWLVYAIVLATVTG